MAGEITGWLKVTGGSNLVSLDEVFDGCSLSSIDINGMDISNVTTMNSCFASMSNLTHLDISNWNTSNVTNMRSLFVNCTNLQCITNLDTTGATDKSDMFTNCSALVAPDATAQADLTDADGADWVNPNACP